MYQKDYILRMLEMMGDFIAAIMARIGKKDFKKASEMLENSYQTFLQSEASFFYNIPTEALSQTLLEKHNYTHNHLEILSELFLAEAELLFAEDKKEHSMQFYQKAKTLMEFLDKNSGNLSIQRSSNLSLIQNRIKELS